MKKLTAVFGLLMIGTMVIHAQMKNEVVLPNGNVLSKPPVPPKDLVHPSRVAPEKRAEAEALWRQWQGQLAAYRKTVEHSAATPLSEEDSRYLAEVSKAQSRYGGVALEKLSEQDRQRFNRHVLDSDDQIRKLEQDPEVIAIVGERPAKEIGRIYAVASEVHGRAVFYRYLPEAAATELRKELFDMKLTDEQAKSLLELMAKKQPDLESKIVRFDRNGKTAKSDVDKGAN